VVHLHGVWDPILRRASAESARLGIPWVLSSHGMLHPFTLRRGFLKKRVYLGVFPGLVGSARAVLTLNREEADAVRRRFGVRTIVAPNGIDPLPYQRVADGTFSRSIPALGGRPFVLFLGRLDPIKGIDQLLAAFGLAVSNGLAADLVIAGPDFGAGPGLRAQVARLGIESRVHLAGPLSGALKLQALAECAVFAHRPRYEGFGLAVAEAMAAARPVVTTERCLLDGAAQAGAIRVVADDDRTFAKGIRDLADDVEGSGLLGMRAREWIRRVLAWPAVIERIESGYRA
jgi:glycosyltransferase involved in cell wall biosynthesis